MKRLDSLYKKNETVKKVAAQRPIVFPLYYFYRSLRVVLIMWVLLLMVIIGFPWANYYIKKTINPAGQQILGTSEVKKTDITSNTKPKQETPTFYLKKGDLEIKAPVTNSISNEDLTKGIGHHPDSVWPNVKGNVVVAGHSFSLDAENQYGQVFGELRQVEIGDQVSVTYQNKKYIYKVFKKEIVSASDMSLMGKSDDWILTFYTCDPPKTDWRRLVLQAELVRIE